MPTEEGRFHVSDVTMIRVLVNEIENLAYERYITDPEDLGEVQDILLNAKARLGRENSMTPIAAAGCSTDDDCPGYWICVRGLCQPGKSGD